ncbi:MAG: tetratricopeptide repeat protein [Luteitalea sp.]|nr:tetratricopeptide repeat protein [Luteitalea sp.]
MRQRWPVLFLWLLVAAAPGADVWQATPPAVRTAAAPPATLQRIADLVGGDDPAAAKAAVDTALASYPSDAALHNLAGVVSARQDAYAAAEVHFKTAIRLAPQSAGPYENLGRLYQERSGVDDEARAKALTTYRQLLRVDPHNVEGLYQAAFLLALEGQFAESRELVGRLPDDVRARPQALAVLAADLAGLSDRAAAAEVVSRLAAHPDLSAEDVTSVLPALDRASDDRAAQALFEALDGRGLATPQLLHRLGRIHATHGRFVEANAVLDRAARGEPSVPILLDLARMNDKLGKRQRALGYLAHARALDPDNATTHFLFGVICVKLNLGAEAYDALTKAVALEPDNALANYALGAVSIHRHDPSEAIPHFKKYVQLVPDDPRGKFALGAARFYSNLFEEARQDLMQATHAPETAAGAHYLLARIARQTNDLDRARRELDEALRANPDYADAWAELGLVRLRMRRYAEAEQSLERALAIDAENYTATLNLATLYARTKDPRQKDLKRRLNVLQEKRADTAQDFLRIIEVVP